MSRCHACDRARQSARYAAIREKAVQVYGGCCSACSSTESLEFDHAEDDGDEHRRVESQPQMLRRIARTGRPLADRKLRLLCRGCHRGPGWKQRRMALVA